MGLEYRDIVQKVIVALGAQSVVLLSNLVAALVVPKFLSVSDFGYWQLFLLYAAYAGVCHFGINDGVYLLNGGKTRRTLDQASVTGQFLLMGLFQVVLGVLVFTLASVMPAADPSRRFVFQMFALYLVAYNLASFLGYLFQALNETRAYSFTTMISRLLFLVGVVVLILVQGTTLEWVIGLFVVGQFVGLVFALIYGLRGILARAARFSTSVRDVAESFRVGWWLTGANLANLLILGVARFTIDARWDIEKFGQLSLVFVAVTFVLQFVTQVSMVLFPALRRLTAAASRSVFEQMRSVLCVVSPFIYVLYFPAYLLISVWLPDYRGALVYLGVMFPVAVFNAVMDVGYTTFFKVARHERTLLYLNVGSVVVMVASSLVSAFVFGSLWGIMAALPIVAFLRWAVADVFLSKRFELRVSAQIAPLLSVGVAFVLSTSMLPLLWSFLATLIVLAVYLVLYRAALTRALRPLIRHRGAPAVGANPGVETGHGAHNE